MDTIAFNLIKAVNSIHQNGFVAREVALKSEFDMPVKDNFGPTTGINFFKDLNSPKNASSNLELSNEVKEDLANITTGILPNHPGDNRVAIAISKIGQQKILNNGRSTMEEEYLKSISEMGTASNKAKFNQEQAQGLLAQTKALKERVSGVSLDEEATNLIRFQNAYQASAKVIKEADDMFKTVLDLKR
jgi:flagellar hook-associated protein 1 FlgK